MQIIYYETNCYKCYKAFAIQIFQFSFFTFYGFLTAATTFIFDFILWPKFLISFLIQFLRSFIYRISMYQADWFVCKIVVILMLLISSCFENQIFITYTTIHIRINTTIAFAAIRNERIECQKTSLYNM